MLSPSAQHCYSDHKENGARSEMKTKTVGTPSIKLAGSIFLFPLQSDDYSQCYCWELFGQCQLSGCGFVKPSQSSLLRLIFFLCYCGML